MNTYKVCVPCINIESFMVEACSASEALKKAETQKMATELVGVRWGDAWIEIEFPVFEERNKEVCNQNNPVLCS